MFCYLVYASSQSRGAEKSQLHKGSSALSFFSFASVSPAQGRMTAIYQALSDEAELLSSPPGILKFRGCVTPSVPQGIKAGPAAKSVCPIRRWWARAASGPCAVGGVACWDTAAAGGQAGPFARFLRLDKCLPEQQNTERL